jgi:hypothetical protein
VDQGTALPDHGRSSFPSQHGAGHEGRRRWRCSGGPSARARGAFALDRAECGQAGRARAAGLPEALFFRRVKALILNVKRFRAQRTLPVPPPPPPPPQWQPLAARTRAAARRARRVQSSAATSSVRRRRDESAERVRVTRSRHEPTGCVPTARDEREHDARGRVGAAVRATDADRALVGRRERKSVETSPGRVDPGVLARSVGLGDVRCNVSHCVFVCVCRLWAWAGAGEDRGGRNVPCEEVRAPSVYHPLRCTTCWL